LVIAAYCGLLIVYPLLWARRGQRLSREVKIEGLIAPTIWISQFSRRSASIDFSSGKISKLKHPEMAKHGFDFLPEYRHRPLG